MDYIKKFLSSFHFVLCIYICFSGYALAVGDSNADDSREPKITGQYSLVSDTFEPCDDWDFSRNISQKFDDLQRMFAVNKSIEAIKQQAAQQHVVSETMTFVIGRAGAGKTKLTDLLNGYKLLARYNKDLGQYEIDRLERSNDTNIRTGDAVQTLPGKDQGETNLWEKVKFLVKKELRDINIIGNKTKSHEFRPDTDSAHLIGTVIDFPGIQNIGSRDPGKSAQIVRDSYEFKQLLKEFRKFKLLVAVPEGDISVAGRAEEFLRVVTRLDAIFPGGFDDYKDRLFFVPSHTVEIKNPQIFKNRVKKMLESRGDAGEKLLSPQEEKILEHISTLPDDRIYIFPKPLQEGEIINGNFLSPYLRARQQFPEYRGTINICVSDSAKSYLEKIMNQPLRGIAELLRLFERNLHFRILPWLHEYNSDIPASRVRQEIRGVAEIFGKNVDPRRVKEALDKIAPPTGQNFKSYVDVYKRYQELLPEEESHEINIEERAGKELEKLSGTLRLLAQGPRWLDSHKETIWGSYILGTSDVQSYIKNFRRNPILCRSTVGIIDADVMTSGLSWLWASPLLKMGKRQSVIDLSGEHAPPTVETVALERDGRDGVPGLPGKSGGHFVGMFDNEDIPYSLLEIRSNGGNGGRGENGNDGNDGENGADEDEKREATSGKVGQDAGKGGKGGGGGYSGTARVLTFSEVNHETRWLHTFKAGSSGKDGEPGYPGKGGRHGCRIAAGDWLVANGNPAALIIKPVGWIGGGGGGVLQTTFQNTGAILTSPVRLFGYEGVPFTNPITDIKRGVKAGNEGSNDILGVKKTKQESDGFASNGKRIFMPNDRGWVAPQANPNIDRQTITSVRSFPWNWEKVTIDYKGKQ